MSMSSIPGFPWNGPTYTPQPQQHVCSGNCGHTFAQPYHPVSSPVMYAPQPMPMPMPMTYAPQMPIMPYVSASAFATPYSAGASAFAGGGYGLPFIPYSPFASASAFASPFGAGASALAGLGGFNPLLSLLARASASPFGSSASAFAGLGGGSLLGGGINPLALLLARASASSLGGASSASASAGIGSLLGLSNNPLSSLLLSGLLGGGASASASAAASGLGSSASSAASASSLLGGLLGGGNTTGGLDMLSLLRLLLASRNVVTPAATAAATATATPTTATATAAATTTPATTTTPAAVVTPTVTGPATTTTPTVTTTGQGPTNVAWGDPHIVYNHNGKTLQFDFQGQAGQSYNMFKDGAAVNINAKFKAWKGHKDATVMESFGFDLNGKKLQVEKGKATLDGVALEKGKEYHFDTGILVPGSEGQTYKGSIKTDGKNVTVNTGEYVFTAKDQGEYFDLEGQVTNIGTRANGLDAVGVVGETFDIDHKNYGKGGKTGANAQGEGYLNFGGNGGQAYLVDNLFDTAHQYAEDKHEIQLGAGAGQKGSATK